MQKDETNEQRRGKWNGKLKKRIEIYASMATLWEGREKNENIVTKIESMKRR